MSNRISRLAASVCCAGTVIGIGIAVAQGQDQNSAATSLSLVCNGNGTATDTETTFTNSYDRKNKSSEHGTAQTNVKHPYTGTSSVEISVGSARIKLPAPMIPPLESSNREGWFPVQDFSMTESEIKGTVRINILNKPKLVINRMTGTMTLSGPYSDFSGQCERLAQDAKPKF